MMAETSFAQKMDQADAFRAKVSAAITSATSNNPLGAATLQTLSETLRHVDDAKLYRLSVAKGSTDMIMKPVKAIVAAIARGDRAPYRNARHMLDTIGDAAMTLAHHRASEKEMAKLLMADRAPGSMRLLRVL
jgi:hypothetical protein